MASCISTSVSVPEVRTDSTAGSTSISISSTYVLGAQAGTLKADLAKGMSRIDGGIDGGVALEMASGHVGGPAKRCADGRRVASSANRARGTW